MSTTVRKIREEDLELIMKWRMSESVTRFMKTNPKLNLEGQKKWLSSIEKDDTVRNWLIEVDGIPAGIINLAEIDWKKRNTSWGYYIGEKKLRSLSLAISLEMSLYDYCFDVLGLKEVHNEVFKINDGVWKLHIACGCKVAKEVKGEIEKDGINYDIVHLSVKRDEWIEIRGNKKYEKIDFDIFQDKISGMSIHHIGVAVANLIQSISEYENLGWKWDGNIIEDKDRNVKLAFMKRNDSDTLIELVAPANEKSPVSHTLNIMKNIATPYHICYEVDEINKMIEILKKRKYILTESPKPAVAFNGRRVSFMISTTAGLIELLEVKKK